MALAFPTPDDGRNIVVTADILPVKRLIALLLLVTPAPLLAGGDGFDELTLGHGALPEGPRVGPVSDIPTVRKGS